jgi:alpha-N-arabinofuranosidase
VVYQPGIAKETAMKNAKYILDKDYAIDPVDRRLFGSFVEHLGRVVYNGLYEPGHPLADEQGFRQDVLAAVRRAHITGVRYPGGNFVSGYHWTDGIGPRSERKRRLNLAWTTIETNEIGIDEFADWSQKAGVDLLATVNLGTGTPQEAGEMVEYCNHPAGTYWSDLRRANGHAQPHAIKLWYLGNEMDGEWQIGRLTAEDYARKALETAKIVKWVDPSVEVVACGSCCTEIPTYPDWDRIVLEHAYEKIDYLSLHRYYSYDPAHHLFYPVIEDKSDIAYFPIDLQAFLHTVISAADLAKTKVHSRKTVNISFDEWNVVSDTNVAFHPVAPWQTSFEGGEERFTLRDALIYGGILCTFLKNADRVKIACQSLLVNVGGMVYTQKGGPLVCNPVYYPFQQVAAYARGVSLSDRISCPKVRTNHHDELPAMQSAAVYDEEDGALNVFIVNFDPEDDCEIAMDLRSFEPLRMVEHVVLDGDLDASNTYAEPENVQPRLSPVRPVDNGLVKVVIPRSSWNVLRFSLRSED